MPSSTFTLTANVPTALADSLGLAAGAGRSAGAVLTLDREVGLGLIRQGYAQSGTYVAPAGGLPTSGKIQVVLVKNVPTALADQLGLAAGAGRSSGAVLNLPQNDALALIRADVAQYGDVHGAGSTGAKTFAVATLDFPSIAAGGSQELTVNVSAALLGDPVVVGAPAGLPAGLVVGGRVTAVGVVTVRVSNVTGAAIDPPASSWKVGVVKF